MKYTKINFDFYIKEFPIGKIYSCIIWYDYLLYEYEITEKIENYIKNYNENDHKRIIAGFKITDSSDHVNVDKNRKIDLVYITNKRYYNIKNDNINDYIKKNLDNDLIFKKMNIRNKLF